MQLYLWQTYQYAHLQIVKMACNLCRREGSQLRARHRGQQGEEGQPGLRYLRLWVQHRHWHRKWIQLHHRDRHRHWLQQHRHWLWLQQLWHWYRSWLQQLQHFQHSWHDNRYGFNHCGLQQSDCRLGQSSQKKCLLNDPNCISASGMLCVPIAGLTESEFGVNLIGRSMQCLTHQIE